MSAPLMLLPGLICDARIFAAQTREFTAQTVDGFGVRHSLESMAQHVLEVGPPRMSLLGHSMGARVALEVFRLAPERVERLALISTGVHPRQPGEAEKRFALLELGRAFGPARLVDEWLPPMIAARNRDKSDMVSTLRQMCVEAGVDAFEAQIIALLQRPEVESLLPRIGCPVLVAVGSDDVWSPPAQHASIAARITNADLQVISGGGHMLPAEAPERLNETITAWLSSPAAG